MSIPTLEELHQKIYCVQPPTGDIEKRLYVLQNKYEELESYYRSVCNRIIHMTENQECNRKYYELRIAKLETHITKLED